MEGQVFIPETAQFVQLYAAHEGILVSWLAHSLLSRKTTYVQQNTAPRQIFFFFLHAPFQLINLGQWDVWPYWEVLLLGLDTPYSLLYMGNRDTNYLFTVHLPQKLNILPNLLFI